MTAYAELCVTTNFTFLRGASHPEKLITRAAELGLKAIAITDWNSVAGVVRAFSALKELHRLRNEALEAEAKEATAGPVIRSQQMMDHSSRQPYAHATGATPPAKVDAEIPLPKLIPGSRLILTDSAVEWLALPTDVPSWSRLTRMLSVGKRRAEKGSCQLVLSDLMEWGTGMMIIALPPDPLGTDARAAAKARADVERIAGRFAGRVYLGAAPRYDGDDQERIDRIAALSQNTGVPMVTVGDVLMHRAARRTVADVLTCIREGCTIDDIGERRLTNGERRLKGAADMARMFHRYPAALRRSIEIADRCAFRLDDLRYQYPDEARDGESAQARLERLARKGIAWRYPHGAPDGISERITKEMQLIGKMGYAPYFLRSPMWWISPAPRRSCVRAEARPRTRSSATCSASPRSIRRRSP